MAEERISAGICTLHFEGSQQHQASAGSVVRNMTDKDWGWCSWVRLSRCGLAAQTNLAMYTRLIVMYTLLTSTDGKELLQVVYIAINPLCVAHNKCFMFRKDSCQLLPLPARLHHQKLACGTVGSSESMEDTSLET